MEGGAAVDARTFQTEALKIEKLLYHISYAMLRNESDCEDAVLDGWRVPEIAQMLDIPEGTVKTRLMHARKRMETLLREVET